MFSAVNAVVVICVHSLIDSIQYDAQLPMADGVVVLLFTEKAKLTIERLGLFIEIMHWAYCTSVSERYLKYRSDSDSSLLYAKKRQSDIYIVYVFTCNEHDDSNIPTVVVAVYRILLPGTDNIESCTRSDHRTR